MQNQLDTIVEVSNREAKKSIARHERKKQKMLAKPKVSMMPPKLKGLTENQTIAIESFNEGFHILMCGSAGTGKTFLGLGLSLYDVMNKKSFAQKVVIIRSPVATKDQGFLPGTLEKKQEVFEIPYMEICHELFGKKDAYETLKRLGVIEFATTSYLRGLTLRDSIVIFDEFQNADFHAIDSVITRLGENSRIVLCGDIKQNDLRNKRYEESGAKTIIEIFKSMYEVETIEFTTNDIVRSGFVKAYIQQKEKFGY